MRRRNAKRCSNQQLRTPAESRLLANLKRLIPPFLFLVCFHSGLELAIGAPAENSLIFERLCRDFRQKQSPESRNLLLQFCKRPDASEWAGLGYFLLGFQDFEKSKFDSAGKYFSLASHIPLVIEDYVLYYWGSTLNQLDQIEKSQERLELLLNNYPDSPFFERGRRLYWENALALEKSQLVLDSISKIKELDSNPEALSYQAQAFEQLKRWPSALNNYNRIHYFFPLYPDADSVDQKLARLSEENASQTFAVPREWRITRIENLFAAKHYRDTLKDLERLAKLDPPFSTTAQFQFWQGMSLFGSGRYYDAIQTLSQLNAPQSEMAAQAAFTVCECYRKLANYSQFKDNIEKMELLFPSSRWLEEAYFSIGNFNLVQRNLDESVLYYQKIVEKFPDGRHVKDALWRIAWRRYREKNYPLALDLFLDYRNRFRESEYRLAAIYWSARCQERLGKTAEAVALYQESMQRFPHHYYGQMAEKRLAALNQGAPVETPTAVRSDVSGRETSVDAMVSGQKLIEGWPRVKALVSMQLFELAGKELMRSQLYGSSPTIDFQVARFFYLDNNFSLSIQRLRRLLPNYAELAYASLPGEVWQMFYPIHFQAAVSREAQSEQIDPYLVLGLIRQESTFNPRALSAANAHGLMQLLPATARKVAREMRIPRPSVARLQDPDLNIRLGTRYLADLLKQFGGQEDKALASYNAGERRVESWLSEGGFTDSAEFVETIPFTETRNYVKIIYRNYWFYRRLYSGLNAPKQ
jgi:soluble lytic murein transglycosylase